MEISWEPRNGVSGEPDKARRDARRLPERLLTLTFLRTAHQQGVDAIAMLVGLARAPNPGVFAGLTLRSG